MACTFGLGWMTVVCRVLVAGLMVSAFAAATRAQSDPLSGVPKACSEAGEASRSPDALPNMVRALREKKRIRVLAIGATPLTARDQAKGHYALVESFLENNYKGLDVEIVDRGVSGELARDASERLQNEVALTSPDVVFWQVGVADAIARTPPAELKVTLVKTIKWLKAHNTDVVLIGMRYLRSMIRDEHYQQLRLAIRDAQRDEAILRIRHYEAIEAIDRIRRQQGEPPTELDLTDAGSICMADFLSRALAAKLFAQPRARAPGAGVPGGPDPAPAAGGASVPPKQN
jgi:hypothetical protein